MHETSQEPIGRSVEVRPGDRGAPRLTPLAIFLRILLITAGAEGAESLVVPVIVERLGLSEGVWESVVGVAVISLIMAPFLYLWVVRGAAWGLAAHASNVRFWQIVDAASDAIISVDDRQRIVVFNKQAARAFGYAEREAIGRPLALLLPSRFRGDHDLHVARFKEEPESQRTMSERPVLLGRRKNGEEFPVEITISKTVSDGQPLMTAIVRDVSERQKIERDLRESREALQDFLDSATDLVQSVGPDGRFAYVNRSWLSALGYTRDEVGRLTMLDVVHPDSRTHCQWVFERVMAGQPAQNVEAVFVAKDGRRIAVEGHIDCHSKDGTAVTRAIFRDITERKLAEERLNHLAHYDTLTGLPNRLLFHDRLNHALAQARRAQQLVVLLFLDLDGFKAVNDTLGHAVGDLLLKAVAQRLAGSVRTSDTVARLGGDEFTVVLHGLTGVQGAAIVAQKILRAIGQPFTLHGHEVSVTASIGITVYPLDSDTIEGLIKNADAAMYRAKAQKSTYQFYAVDTQCQVADRFELECDLRRALEQDEFGLVYQPYADLETRRVVGAQALVRWTRPGLGVVEPAEFGSLIEDSGLLEPIGEFVLRAACAQNRMWQASGLPPVRVAVTLTGRQLAQPRLVDTVVRVLHETGLDPRLLELAFTEDIFLAAGEANVAKLRELHARGVVLSIADFGTGRSSPGDLKRFSIQMVRIGGGFVSRLAPHPDDATIVAAILAMAHGLGLKVVAEGVEDEEQAAFLRAHRCDMVQGGLVSRPLPADAFAQFLTRREPSEDRAA
jgi:diguanylate cyclase (GGDEF)-like protein/PAS domain S-box-containing protein